MPRIDAREQGHRIARRHGRCQDASLEGGLLEREPAHRREDQHVHRPAREEREDAATELGDERLRHGRLESVAEPSRSTEHQRLGGTGETPAHGEQHDHERGADQAGPPPGSGARVIRSALGLSGGDEEDDAGQRERGPGQLASPDVLVRQQGTEGEREDEAECSEGLHRHQRGAVKRRRLHDPARGLQHHAGEPHRAVQDLEQETRVVARRRGGEGALLLEDGAQREQQSRQDGQRLTHGAPG